MVPVDEHTKTANAQCNMMIRMVQMDEWNGVIVVMKHCGFISNPELMKAIYKFTEESIY